MPYRLSLSWTPLTFISPLSANVRGRACPKSCHVRGSATHRPVAFTEGRKGDEASPYDPISRLVLLRRNIPAYYVRVQD